MKHLLIALAFGLTNLPLIAADTTIVQAEYAKQQSQFEARLTAVRKLKAQLEAQKEKAIQESKIQESMDTQGVTALKKFYTLMLGRYATDDGQFQPWRPIDAKDIENINKLFETYLRSHPLRGRVSAGEADRTLEWGMERLEQLAKMHSSPKEDNNSDLEILSHQLRDAEAKEKTILSLADRMGMKLNDHSSSDEHTQAANDAATDSNARQPTSMLED